MVLKFSEAAVEIIGIAVSEKLRRRGIGKQLIIRGNNQSLIYAINNMGQLVSAEVDTIDGYVLTERTITADKIVVHSITANELAAHQSPLMKSSPGQSRATRSPLPPLKAATSRPGR